MEIKGSIRASATGIDVGIKGNDNRFHQLASGPLLGVISDFYKLIISNNNRTVILDRTYEVDVFTSNNGTVRRSVTIPTAFGTITVYRYIIPNSPVSSHRAAFSLDIPTIEVFAGEEDEAN